MDDIVPQHSSTHEPNDVESQPSLIQRPDNHETQSIPSQSFGDVPRQHSLTKESGSMETQSSSNHNLPVDVPSRNLVFNLGSEQAPQIGDTNIQTTGPVYNAPVYEQHITQYITVNQRYKQAHSSSQSPATHSLDEETPQKLPASFPLQEQAHNSSQSPATHSLAEETSPKRPETTPSREQAHNSSQSPATHSLDKETSPKRPGTTLSREQAHRSSQLRATHGLDEKTSPKLAAIFPSPGQRQSSSEHQRFPSTHQQMKPKPAATNRRETGFATHFRFLRKQRQKPKDVLKEQLKQRTKAIASEESTLADIAERKLTPVNLAIVSKPQQIDDEFLGEGHYRSRKEFAKIHYRLESDITCKEMFARAKKTAQQEVKRKFKLNEMKAIQDYVEKHGNVVGVVGQAGIGKTTSAKKWAVQGLRGELFGETSFFFYIVIRRIDFTREMTLLQFLLSPMSMGQDYTLNEEKNILSVICSDPNVVIIFDGLDEAAFKSFSTEVPQPSVHSKSKAENYLKHLAGGNLLPRARKIFTSRPAQLYKLHPSYRPRFIVQILGLTPTSQDELGRQICGDRYDLIQQKLVQNSNVFAYCYVPVNFILTLNYLTNYHEDIQFVSLTRVLAFTCGQYTRTEHMKDEDRWLDKLAKFAFVAFLQMEIVFEILEFKKAGIKESTADAFTNTSVTKYGNIKLTILEGDKVRYFSHLIWQEFFAGFYLMMIMSLDEFEKILKQLEDDRWEVVSKFVFGICDPLVFHQLRPLIPESSIKDWKQKISCLLKFIQSISKLNDKEEILRVCSWAYESNNAEIASYVASLLPDELDFRDLSLLPLDLEQLFFVIQHRTTPLKRLDLSLNKIGNMGAASLSLCLHTIEELILWECEIESEGVEKLCDGVEKLTKPLKKLVLSFNKIGNAGATSLARCLNNIEELILKGCDIRTEGVKKLCDGVEKLTKPLKNLDLSFNEIGNTGGASLTPCVHNTKGLILQKCGIEYEGVKKLCGGVKKLTEPMELLDLSWNLLKYDSAVSLSQCVHNIKLLKVERNNFTTTGETFIISRSRGEVVFKTQLKPKYLFG